MTFAKLKIILVILVHCTPCYLSNMTCENALMEVKSLLKNNKRDISVVRDEDFSRYQGIPGKRGAIGPPGPMGLPGQVGPRGRQGACTCDISSITSQLRELQEFKNNVRRSPGMCYVGISAGLIKPSQLSASSVHSTCPFKGVVLHSGGAWCTGSLDSSQWVQVDFFVPRLITGIVTQGRANSNQWVTSYHVSYGNDSTQMTLYTEFDGLKTFVGNSDENTIVENTLREHVTARYIRIHPVSYHEHMSMRIEMRQC